MGVTEAIYIKLDADTKNYIVYEGNTRLACVKHLLKNEPNSLQKRTIKVEILDPKMEMYHINYIVGRAHLIGKKQWDSYEANSFLYREYQDRREKKFDNESDTIRDLVNEFGIKPAQVKNSIKAFEFLEKHQLVERNLGVEKYSYFESYANSPVIQKLAILVNDPESAADLDLSVTKKNAFDDMFIKQVQRDNCPKTVDIRDYLIKIARAAENKNFNALKELINDGADVEDAVVSVDQEQETIITLFSNLAKKIDTINTSALLKQIELEKGFKSKLQKIKNFLETNLNLDGVIDEATETAMIVSPPRNPDNKATFRQIRMLATKYDQLPSKPAKINFKNLEAYFYKKLNSDKGFTQGEWHTLLLDCNKEKKIPKDIVRDIEDYLDRD